MRDDDYAGFLPNDRNEGDEPEQQPDPESEPTESPDHQPGDDQETEGITVVITPPERRNIPQSFLAMLAELGYEALNKWLEDQAAPKEITDLAEALHAITAMQESGEMNSADFLGSTCMWIANGCSFAKIDYQAGGSIWPA